MTKQKFIKQIGIFLLILAVALILTFFSRIVIQTGERTSTGSYVPGFPIQIFDLNSKGCPTKSADGVDQVKIPGCSNFDFLLLPFVFDIVFWVVLMYLIIFAFRRFKSS